MLQQKKPITLSIEEALQHFKNGDSLVLGHGATTPDIFTRELVRQATPGRKLHMFMLIHLGNHDFLAPEMADYIEVSTIFMSGVAMKKAVAEGRANYIPCHFSQLPALFGSRDDVATFPGATIPVDWAVVQVTPPDAQGRYSLSASCDYVLPAVRKAKKVLAIVNDQLPFIGGDNFITADQVDIFVEHSEPAYATETKPSSELDRQIAQHCIPYIPDGATLQAGIGGIPDAVLSMLTGHKDLGVHTELLTPSIQKLHEIGAITGAKKGHRNGKMVAAFAMGDHSFYQWMHNNPDLELYPVDVINGFGEISSNNKMISINSAVEVDLKGQVNAEMIGDQMFSGSGGQVDFVRGARASKGGMNIIALPSTAKNGTISRIVPSLRTGTAVTTSRNDLDAVITEFGVAELRGKTELQRAKALISIAHPNHQEALERALFKK